MAQAAPVVEARGGLGVRSYISANRNRVWYWRGRNHDRCPIDRFWSNVNAQGVTDTGKERLLTAHWDRRRVLSLIAAVLAVLLKFVETPYPQTGLFVPTVGFGDLPGFAIAAAAGLLAVGRLRRAAYALLVACLILSVPEAAAFGAAAMTFLLGVALLLFLIGLWRSIVANAPAPVDLRRLTVMGLAVAFVSALPPLDGPAFVMRLGVVAGGLMVGVLLLMGPWRSRTRLLTVLLLVVTAVGGCLAQWLLTTTMPPLSVTGLPLRFADFDGLGLVPTVAALFYVGLLRLPDVLPKTGWPRIRAGVSRVGSWLSPLRIIEFVPIVVAATAVLLPLGAIADRANQFALQAPWSAQPAVGGVPVDSSTGLPADAWPPLGHFVILIEPVAAKPASNAATMRFTLMPPQKLKTGEDDYQLTGELPKSYTLYVTGCEQTICQSGLPIPSSAFRSRGGGFEPIEFATDLDVAMTGDPKLFPSDRYTVQTGTRLVNGDDQSTVEHDLYVGGPVGSSDLDVSLPRTCCVAGTQRTVFAILSRSVFVSAFVYAIALTPLVFAVVIGHLLLGRDRIETADQATLYLGLAVAGLTLLPLRVVLLPGEVATASLTIADLVLGTEFGLLALLAALAHRQRMRQAPKPAPDPSSPNDAATVDASAG